MKTVVVTGNARGFGFEMTKLFLKNNCNVVLLDVNIEELNRAKNELELLNLEPKIFSKKMDVTNEEEVIDGVNSIVKEFGNIDIWINNAGVNQPDKYIWELSNNEINKIIDIDLKGTITCSRIVMNQMIKQGFGSIYNVEGFGSDNAKIEKLSIYGTAKRAVTYFTEALANEVNNYKNIYVGKITPGIMITNFIYTSLGDGEKIEISDETKKIYNILGDYPETIAEYMVDKILKNNKNNAKFTWLTKRRAFIRFLKAPFSKRNLFKD